MVKHTNASFAKILSLILTTWFEVLFLIALILSIIFNGTKELKIGFGLIVITLFVYQFVFIEFVCYIFSRVSKNTIKISKNTIETNKYIINANETRIIYSKINYSNIVNYCPGELIAIVNGDGIRLGWFTKKEINKMKKYIQNIIIQ